MIKQQLSKFSIGRILFREFCIEIAAPQDVKHSEKILQNMLDVDPELFHGNIEEFKGRIRIST